MGFKGLLGSSETTARCCRVYLINASLPTDELFKMQPSLDSMCWESYVNFHGSAGEFLKVEMLNKNILESSMFWKIFYVLKKSFFSLEEDFPSSLQQLINIMEYYSDTLEITIWLTSNSEQHSSARKQTQMTITSPLRGSLRASRILQKVE